MPCRNPSRVLRRRNPPSHTATGQFELRPPHFYLALFSQSSFHSAGSCAILAPIFQELRFPVPRRRHKSALPPLIGSLKAVFHAPTEQSLINLRVSISSRRRHCADSWNRMGCNQRFTARANLSLRKFFLSNLRFGTDSDHGKWLHGFDPIQSDRLSKDR